MAEASQPGTPETPLVLIPVTAEDVARRKRRLVLACSAAILAAAGTAGWLYKRSVDPMHARESYDAGVRLLKVAEYSHAILSFDRAVSLKPDLAEAYLMRGKAYAGEAKTDQAIADFSHAIALRPDDTAALIERAAAFLDLNDFQATIQDANRALQLNRKLAVAYHLRATAIRSLGDPRRALEDFTRAVELSPDAANYYQRGATYQMLGDHQRAIADFDQVIAIKPDTPSAYFARAEARRASGDVKGAQADHQRARLLDGR